MTRTYLHIISTWLVILCGASSASAQIVIPSGATPAVTTNFNFSIPFALTVSHPCQARLILINGAVNVDLKTVTGTDFKFELSATGAGSGDAVNSFGQPLGEASYVFDAAARARATFPKGKPAFFAHTLTVDGLLDQPAGDIVAVAVVLDVEYKYGVPSAPKIESIDVSCVQ